MTKKAIATRPGQPTLVVDLTPDEENQRIADAAAEAAEAPKRAAREEIGAHQKMIRAFEALVEVLFAKNVIQLSDFDPDIRALILARKAARDELNSSP